MADFDVDAGDLLGDPGAPIGRTSPLEELRKEVQQQVANEPVTVGTKVREGWAVRFRTDLELPRLNAWRKRATDRQAPDGFDQVLVSMMLLANQCEALVKDGQDVVSETGELLTFRDHTVWEWMGVSRAVDAVKHWYGKDGHILATAEEVALAAGFGALMDQEESPTRRS